MEILNWYYKKCGAGDLREISERFGLKVDWIIEAGCHDGTDTLELIKHFPKARIYAFEPDPKSRAIAESRFQTFATKRIELFPFGLSNIGATKFLDYVNNEKGNGTSSISEIGTDPVETIALDDFEKFPANSGLLWLDVEGHAINALIGMKKTLNGIELAKIEIQMHEKSEQRPQDFQQVITIMKQAGLVPLFVPLHPGYFGDIYFARVTSLNKRNRLKSLALRFQMWLLHMHIYPILHKPSD